VSRSRMARQVLQSTVYAAAERIGHTLPHECSWHPSRDSVAADEAFMTIAGRNRFACTLCHKAFRTEDYLDLHLLRRHNATLLASRVGGRVGARRATHAPNADGRLADVRCCATPATRSGRVLCRLLRHAAVLCGRGARRPGRRRGQGAAGAQRGALSPRWRRRAPHNLPGTATTAAHDRRRWCADAARCALVFLARPQRTLGKCFPPDAGTSVAAANGAHGPCTLVREPLALTFRS